MASNGAVGEEKALKVLRHRVVRLYRNLRHVGGWRAVGRALGISEGLAWRIAVEGYMPKGAGLRRKLGLPELGSVVVVGEGTVKEGAQALGSVRCVRCGAEFVSNHPLRRKCFRCSKPRISKI